MYVVVYILWPNIDFLTYLLHLVYSKISNKKLEDVQPYVS